MKITINLLILLLFTNTLFSQTDEDFCITLNTTVPDPIGVYSKSTDVATLENFNIKKFNIFFWGINKDDGSYTEGGNPLTPQAALQSVEFLNDAFSDLNICFNLIGMDTINSTAHHTNSSLSLIHSFADDDYAKQNAFNIYVPHRLQNGSGQGQPHKSFAAVNDVSLVSNKLVHEIGHNFNLLHTFDDGNTRPDPINCERVTRIETNPDYNADIAGDKVTDTNAVPNFYREQRNHACYAVEQADIGYNWFEAKSFIFSNEYGFSLLPDAFAIEQALLDYGFTTSEVNYLKYNLPESFAYFDKEDCIYNPDSRADDPNSPFFKDCGGTPYQVETFDTENYMAYTWNLCRNIFTTGQGIRAHETIEEDFYGEFTPRLTNDIDLYIRDSETDISQEPNIHTNIFWNSNDIWVRNQNDGSIIQEHQNPVYNPNEPNYAYVKIKNNSCNTSSGNDQLKLYWAKANTALTWPLHWEGQLTVIDDNDQVVLMGDEIGTITIPSISKGESTILEFEWPVPNPNDYLYINNENPWHFCLLARIVSDDDPMSFPEQMYVTHNAKNNNNIAWKNLTIISFNTDMSTPIGGVVAVGNIFNQTKNFTLEFVKEEQEIGKPIYEEAEITISLDSIIYNAWNNGGKLSQNFNSTIDSTKIRVNNNYALIDNIQLNPNEIGTISVDFNFLTKELTAKDKYVYHLIQRDASTNEIIGGETFNIQKQERPIFSANAGEDRSIEKNQSITITAQQINEDATYNWYDPEGNLIYSGTDLSISPEITKTYKLEIVSSLDGFKDYDEVKISINPYRIQSLNPNPAENVVNINYITTGANSAYIMLVNTNTGNSDNYILNTEENTTSIDVSSYPTGLYNIILVCNGEIQNSKTLIKE